MWDIWSHVCSPVLDCLVPWGGGWQLTALIHWELDLCAVRLTMAWLIGSRRSVARSPSHGHFTGSFCLTPLLLLCSDGDSSLLCDCICFFFCTVLSFLQVGMDSFPAIPILSRYLVTPLSFVGCEAVIGSLAASFHLTCSHISIPPASPFERLQPVWFPNKPCHWL